MYPCISIAIPGNRALVELFGHMKSDFLYRAYQRILSSQSVEINSLIPCISLHRLGLHSADLPNSAQFKKTGVSMMHRIEIRERFRARRELASLILQELRGEEVRTSRDLARPVRGPAPGPIERILRTIDEWNLGAPPQGGGGFAKKVSFEQISY